MHQNLIIVFIDDADILNYDVDWARTDMVKPRMLMQSSQQLLLFMIIRKKRNSCPLYNFF